MKLPKNISWHKNHSAKLTFKENFCNLRNYFLGFVIDIVKVSILMTNLRERKFSGNKENNNSILECILREFFLNVRMRCYYWNVRSSGISSCHLCNYILLDITFRENLSDKIFEIIVRIIGINFNSKSSSTNAFLLQRERQSFVRGIFAEYLKAL